MVDVNDMCKTNEEFKKKLKGLSDLSEYKKGKLGLYNNETYVSWNYFQGLQRSYYGESIDSLIPFLYNNINDYCIFYNMIVYAKKILIDADYNKKIEELRTENEVFFEKIYKGLIILKEQYDNIEILKNINFLVDKLNELHITNAI